MNLQIPSNSIIQTGSSAVKVNPAFPWLIWINNENSIAQSAPYIGRWYGYQLSFVWIQTTISSVRAVSDPKLSFQPILFEGSSPSVSGDRVAVLGRIRFVEKSHSTKASNLLNSVGMIPMLARVCDNAELNVCGLYAQRIGSWGVEELLCQG